MGFKLLYYKIVDSRRAWVAPPRHQSNTHARAHAVAVRTHARMYTRAVAARTHARTRTARHMPRVCRSGVMWCSRSGLGAKQCSAPCCTTLHRTHHATHPAGPTVYGRGRGRRVHGVRAHHASSHATPRARARACGRHAAPCCTCPWMRLRLFCSLSLATALSGCRAPWWRWRWSFEPSFYFFIFCFNRFVLFLGLN